MTIPYAKPPLPLPDQLALLQKRGMAICDPQAALRILEQVGYYRLSGYALPWRQPPGDQFKPGVTFDAVWGLYEFDRQLRDLLWEGIEAIEITLRTRMTLHLTLKHNDPFAHLRHAIFQPQWLKPRAHLRPPKPSVYEEWLTRLDAEVLRSHDLFIAHFEKTYDGFPRIPMWVASEVMSFGALSQLFGMFRPGEQAPIAKSLGLHERYLPSWIHALSVLRNACAHHGRCWDRLWDITPTLPYDAAWAPFYVTVNGQRMVEHRIGVLIFIVYRLLVAIGHPQRTEWRTRMRIAIGPIQPQWGARMGLRDDWFSSPLWND